jgi:hypothetical protein
MSDDIIRHHHKPSQLFNYNIIQQANSIITMKSSLKRPLVESLKSGPSILPEASSFHLLHRQLESNQIKSLRIGFCESCRTINDYAKLCRVLRQNASLTVVEIGWELPRSVLLKTLEQVARLPSLESLTLASYTNIPKRLLQSLVSKPTLKHLELRNIATGPRPWKDRILLTANGKVVVESSVHQHVSVLANHFADSIESLHIVACDINEQDVNRICAWTAKRTRRLDELSLALSSWVAPKCLETLCQRAICRRLDLTGCGLTDSDASVIARYLPQSQTIEELVVARNLLWGSGGTEHNCSSRQGFDDFVQVALRHLKSLDVSFCSLSKDQVRKILQILTHSKDTSLESLTMLGIPERCDEDSILLKQILQNNTVLKSLRLHPTTDLYRTPSSSEEEIKSIENSLVDNYTLEQLQVGHTSLLTDLLLGLNRAGRRHFRQDPNTPVDWAKVLSRASSDPGVLYWLLQNGVDRVFNTAGSC